MKRKVNKVGQNTLTVSLPKRWTEIYGVKAGENIELNEIGSLITIGFSEIKEKKEITFDLKEKEFMNRILLGPYLKGYDSITIKYTNPQTYSKILKSMKHLVGFEIVEQKEGFCKVEEISKGTNETFDKTMIRSFHVTSNFISEVNRQIQEQSNVTEDLLEIEFTADRLALYCRRLINKNIVSGKTSDNTAAYNIICILERISDEMRIMVEKLIENKINKIEDRKKYDELFKSAIYSLDITLKKYNNFLNEKNNESYMELAIKQRKEKHRLNELTEKIQSKDLSNRIILNHLTNVFEHIQHMSEELIG